MNFKVFFITKSEESQNYLKLNQLLELLPEEVASCFEPICIIDSIEGAELKLNPVGLINKLYMTHNPSSVSRYLTHRSIYLKVIQEDIDSCMIFEDEVSAGDIINLLLINPDLPEYADICNLSIDGIKKLNAYYITNRGARNILDRVDDTRWLNSIKRFSPKDYGLPEEYFSYKQFTSEPLQDFTYKKTIIAPIDQLIFAACQNNKIPSSHGISFINSILNYNTFPIDNNLEGLSEEGVTKLLSPPPPHKPKIDYIFYINLDQDVEKMNRTESMLEQVGVPFERFPAIKPILKDIESGGEYKEVFHKSKILECRAYFNENFDRLDIEKYQLGTLGCYLSHYKLLQRILSMDIPMDFVIIIEDDCFFNTESLSAVGDTIKGLPEDWDILRSTWSAPGKLNQIKYSHPLSNSYEASMQREILCNIKSLRLTSPSACPIIHTFCGGTHFQAINVKSIPKILKYLDSEVLMPIDSLYNSTRLNVYNKKMNISHDIFSKSSIQLQK